VVPWLLVAGSLALAHGPATQILLRALGPAALTPLLGLGLLVGAAALVGMLPMRRALARGAGNPRADDPAVLVGLALLCLGPLVAASRDPLPAALDFNRAVLPHALLVLLAALLGLTRPTLEGTRRLATAAVGVAAVSVLLDAVLGGSPVGGKRPQGLFVGRDGAAEYLAVLVPLVLVQARRHTWARLVLPVAGYALLVSRCRAAWLSVLVAVAVLLLLVQRRRPGLLGPLALLVAGAGLAAVLPSRLRWSEPSPYAASARRLVDLGAGSGAWRLAQYRTLPSLLGERWLLGLGPGRWRAAMERVDPLQTVEESPHSDYLREWADGGLAALVGLVGLLALGLGRSFRARSQAPDLPAALLAVGLISLADAAWSRPEHLTVGLVVCAAAWTVRPAPAEASSPTTPGKICVTAT
jgi:O-antigen ligase